MLYYNLGLLLYLLEELIVYRLIKSTLNLSVTHNLQVAVLEILYNC